MYGGNGIDEILLVHISLFCLAINSRMMVEMCPDPGCNWQGWIRHNGSPEGILYTILNSSHDRKICEVSRLIGNWNSMIATHSHTHARYLAAIQVNELLGLGCEAEEKAKRKNDLGISTRSTAAIPRNAAKRGSGASQPTSSE